VSIWHRQWPGTTGTGHLENNHLNAEGNLTLIMQSCQHKINSISSHNERQFRKFRTKTKINNGENSETAQRKMSPSGHKSNRDTRYYSFKIREATLIRSEHLMRCQEVRGLAVRSPSILTEGIRGIPQSHQLNVGTSFEQTMTTSFYKPSRLTTDSI